MAKFNAKNLVLFIFLGVLLAGIIGMVSAQQAFPTGGDSFETAVEIEPGSYEGVGLEKNKPEYFYINVKPGQEFKMGGTFEAFPNEWGEETLGLYNENREKLVEVGETLDKGQQALFSFSWLPNADKDLYKYYIKRECTWHKIKLLSLNMSLTDRYDIGSQADAGDTFEKAMAITTGNYTGYLSGEEGTDTKDFYKISIKKGKALTAKVTPPGEAAMRIVIYGSNRAVLKSEEAPNPGAIVEASLIAKKSEDLFVEVFCDRWCSENLVSYTLNLAIQSPAEAGIPVEEEGMPGEMAPEGEEIGIEEGVPTEGPNWLLILGIIAAIVVIGVVAYFLLKRKKTTTS